MSKKAYNSPCLEQVEVLECAMICTSIYDSMDGLGNEEVGDSGNDITW